VLTQRIPVNIRFLITTFKEGAENWQLNKMPLILGIWSPYLKRALEITSFISPTRVKTHILH
jgi:hypothetical protein